MPAFETFIPPTTYKAAIFKKKGAPLELIDVEWKAPAAGHIVVKVLACGVCHSDEVVKYEILATLPLIPGHEIVGDVAAVHETEKRWKVGDRVGSGWHGGHCYTCRRCNVGDFMTCENNTANGIKIDGGYAEFVTLRSESAALVPEDIDPAEAAPMFCAGVTTFGAMRYMDIKPGELVAVQGIGGLGHLAIQFSKAMGFRTVALSSSGAKEELARGLGASEYIDGSKVDQTEALQKLGGAKAIIATAPNAKVIHALFNALAVDGIMVVLAVSEDIPVPTVPLIQKRLSVRGWPSGDAQTSRDTILFAMQMGVKCMVERFPLDQADVAYEHMASGKARFRAVICP